MENPRLQHALAQAPARATVVLLVLGMALGMVTAYAILPTEYTGASPRHMSQQAIQQWVRMAAVGHSQGIHYDDANVLLILEQIPNPQAVVAQLASDATVPAAEQTALQAITALPGFESLVGAEAPQDPGVVLSSLQILLAIGIVAIAVPALVVALRLLNANGAPAAARQASAATPAADVAAAPTSQPQVSAAMDATTQVSASVDLGPPLMQARSSYVKGSEYDDSYAIELSTGAFLGECGFQAATHIGDELQSVEFWGFDREAQQTMGKIFAAPAALQNPAFQAAASKRVQNPARDIVAAQSGATLSLELGMFQAQAIIQSVRCNDADDTADSGIESLELELRAWPRLSPPQSSTNTYPSQAFPEYSAATRPASADLPQEAEQAPPPEDHDDPFGGTGDFRPALKPEAKD